MSVVDGSFDHPLALEEHATLPLAGGIEQMGFQCGQLWGAALAAGAQAHRLLTGRGRRLKLRRSSRAEACALLPRQLQEHQLHRGDRSGLEERESYADNQVLPQRGAYPLLQHDCRLCAGGTQ